MTAAAAREAITAGAYDAWSLSDAGADARLLDRLRELSAPEDPSARHARHRRRESGRAGHAPPGVAGGAHAHAGPARG